MKALSPQEWVKRLQKRGFGKAEGMHIALKEKFSAPTKKDEKYWDHALSILKKIPGRVDEQKLEIEARQAIKRTKQGA